MVVVYRQLHKLMCLLDEVKTDCQRYQVQKTQNCHMMTILDYTKSKGRTSYHIVAAPLINISSIINKTVVW